MERRKPISKGLDVWTVWILIGALVKSLEELIRREEQPKGSRPVVKTKPSSRLVLNVPITPFSLKDDMFKKMTRGVF